MDWAVLSPEGVSIYDKNDQPIERRIQQSLINDSAVSKGSYDHFMLKEIYEQPHVIEKTLQSFLGEGALNLSSLPWEDEHLIQ